jgi:hypothetical protein
MVGLKGICSKDKTAKFSLNQVQVAEDLKKRKKFRLTPAALRNLPISIFGLSSVASGSDISPNDLPLCSICLEEFADGDELRTLECSHCYHKGCIDIWLLGCMSEGNASTCNCPDCRQELVFPSHPSPVVFPAAAPAVTPSVPALLAGSSLVMSSSSSSSPAMDSSAATVMMGSFVDVPSASFLRIGRSMSLGGKDAADAIPESELDPSTGRDDPDSLACSMLLTSVMSVDATQPSEFTAASASVALHNDFSRLASSASTDELVYSSDDELPDDLTDDISQLSDVVENVQIAGCDIEISDFGFSFFDSEYSDCGFPLLHHR